MTHRVSSDRRFRCTMTGDGRPGPIEERIGRRLVGLVDAESDEGRDLLGAGSVEWIGPDGNALGLLNADQAYARMLERLDRRMRDLDRQDLVDGRARLRAWSERILRP